MSHSPWLQQSLHTAGTQEVSAAGREGGNQAGCHPLPLLLRDTPKGSSSGVPSILIGSILRFAIWLLSGTRVCVHFFSSRCG